MNRFGPAPRHSRVKRHQKRIGGQAPVQFQAYIVWLQNIGELTSPTAVGREQKRSKLDIWHKPTIASLYDHSINFQHLICVDHNIDIPTLAQYWVAESQLREHRSFDNHAAYAGIA